MTCNGVAVKGLLCSNENENYAAELRVMGEGLWVIGARAKSQEPKANS